MPWPVIITSVAGLELTDKSKNFPWSNVWSLSSPHVIFRKMKAPAKHDVEHKEAVNIDHVALYNLVGAKASCSDCIFFFEAGFIC